MDKSIKQDSLQLGVCYYPEHWNEALWPDDLRRMAVLGIHTVRVFECLEYCAAQGGCI